MASTFHAKRPHNVHSLSFHNMGVYWITAFLSQRKSEQHNWKPPFTIMSLPQSLLDTEVPINYIQLLISPCFDVDFRSHIRPLYIKFRSHVRPLIINSGRTSDHFVHIQVAHQTTLYIFRSHIRPLYKYSGRTSDQFINIQVTHQTTL